MNVMKPEYYEPMKAIDWIICGLLAVNALLFVLTFIPAISGIGSQPGLFDRLFRHGDGWRDDVVWMFFSSLGLILAGIQPITDRGPRRTMIILCRVWPFFFLLYMGYVVMHMFG